jgi:hypothetical protein
VDDTVDQFNEIVVGYLPHLIGAPATLALGWLVAARTGGDCPWGAAAHEY